MDINNIKVPKIIEEYSFEKIKEAIILSIKKRIPDYEPLESDRYMAIIEAVAYREMILRARINEAIKAMLLPTATGSDLDNVIAMYALERRKGQKPRADIELSLSVKLDTDTTIYAGTAFTNQERKHFARLIEDVTIPTGLLKIQGKIELEEFTTDSIVKTETCVTPLKFLLAGKQLTSFIGGMSEETDETFRLRAIKSLERFSTAGSIESYKYHAFAASMQVLAVHVDSPRAGCVRVVIQVKGDIDRAVKDVKAALTNEKVRPLTDFIEVTAAKQIDTAIKAELELLNIFEEAAIIAKIENDFNKKIWALGEDLNISYIYKMLHIDGIYRVKLISPLTDIKVEADEYINVALNLKCLKADL